MRNPITQKSSIILVRESNSKNGNVEKCHPEPFDFAQDKLSRRSVIKSNFLKLTNSLVTNIKCVILLYKHHQPAPDHLSIH